MRCVACGAVTARLAGLELPVVVVMRSWGRDDRDAGIGLALVDRWRAIARCACRLTLMCPVIEADLFAHGRAVLWAPTATIADTPTDYNDALKETLCRTRPADHRAVRDCFHAAVHSAVQLAEDAREWGRMGTRIEPEKLE